MTNKKSESLGYGYIFHYNEYTKLWECTHSKDMSCLFGLDNTERADKFATGKTIDIAAANYIKKFNIK